ncbi:DELLA protein GAI, partial [Linum grandiflorum]
QHNVKLAEALVKHTGLLAASQSGAMRKVATYFAEALGRRIYKIYPRDHCLDPLEEMHFYETSPYLKFAHFTANQAILEAFATSSHVHVIDFGLKQVSRNDRSQIRILRIRRQQFIGSGGGDARLAPFRCGSGGCQLGVELHRLLAELGGIEKLLKSIKAMNPKIVTMVEQEANHNGAVFVDRFTEALHYYSTLFDSLEGS